MDGTQFDFGKNWEKFLTVLNETRISKAEESLKQMLQVDDLRGKSFLDIGSGSGLFSLAARRLGARVHSFDYDSQSVACTATLRRRLFHDDPHWQVEEGSVLDSAYLESLGKFDIVYAWGVLHHTGSMWQALENVSMPVSEGGKLYIAIYNDQHWLSSYWKLVKVTYNKIALARPVIIAVHLPYLFGIRFLVRALTGRLMLDRGMSIWHDMIDWLGGYPYEVAKPHDIIQVCSEMGLSLVVSKTYSHKQGCNEFIFERVRLT